MAFNALKYFIPKGEKKDIWDFRIYLHFIIEQKIFLEQQQFSSALFVYINRIMFYIGYF